MLAGGGISRGAVIGKTNVSGVKIVDYGWSPDRIQSYFPGRHNSCRQDPEQENVGLENIFCYYLPRSPMKNIARSLVMTLNFRKMAPLIAAMMALGFISSVTAQKKEKGPVVTAQKKE